MQRVHAAQRANILDGRSGRHYIDENRKFIHRLPNDTGPISSEIYAETRDVHPCRAQRSPLPKLLLRATAVNPDLEALHDARQEANSSSYASDMPGILGPVKHGTKQTRIPAS